MPPKCFDTPRHAERARRSGRWRRPGERCGRRRAGRSPLTCTTARGVDVELDRRRPFQEHRAEDVGPLEQLAGGAVEADLALLHEVRRLGHGQRHVDRLLHEDHRGALLLEPLHRHEQLGDHARREAERELVDHQQPRARQQRHGEGEHLLLAAAEVGRGLAASGPRARGTSPAPAPPPAARLVSVAIEPAGEPQVLLDGQRREHALPAGDHARCPGPRSRGAVRRWRRARRTRSPRRRRAPRRRWPSAAWTSRRRWCRAARRSRPRRSRSSRRRAPGRCRSSRRRCGRAAASPRPSSAGGAPRPGRRWRSTPG